MEQNLETAKRLRQNHPDRVPIVIKRHKNSKLKKGSALNEIKVLALEENKVFQLMQVIRQKLNLDRVDALYLFVNDNEILRPNRELKDVYEQYKAKDGFLYFTYCEYHTFGYNQFQ